MGPIWQDVSRGMNVNFAMVTGFLWLLVGGGGREKREDEKWLGGCCNPLGKDDGDLLYREGVGRGPIQMWLLPRCLCPRGGAAELR